MSTIEKKTSYPNITLLRGVASGLVVYAHLFANASQAFLKSPVFPVKIVREYFTTPAGIIQDFGWFAVVLFFLISGFLITHVSEQETQLEFAIRRIFRIYPPLIVAILFGVFLLWLGGKNLLSLSDYLISFTLLNYIMVPPPITLGVAWTLVIEVFFYGLILLILPVLKKKPVVAVLIELALVAVVLFAAKNLGPNFFAFAASFSYMPYLLAGQFIYFLHAKKISFPVFCLFTFAAFLLIVAQVKMIYVTFYAADNSYIISFFYAYFLFCITLLFQHHIIPSKLMNFASNTSYSLYLYHGTVGYFLLEQVSKFFRKDIIIVPIVLMCYLFAYLSYRFIELPSIRLGRLCANRLTQWFVRNPKPQEIE